MRRRRPSCLSMVRGRPDYPACVPADKLKDMPNLIRVKSCDEQRAKIAG